METINEHVATHLQLSSIVSSIRNKTWIGYEEVLSRNDKCSVSKIEKYSGSIRLFLGLTEDNILHLFMSSSSTYEYRRGMLCLGTRRIVMDILANKYEHITIVVHETLKDFAKATNESFLRQDLEFHRDYEPDESLEMIRLDKDINKSILMWFAKKMKSGEFGPLIKLAVKSTNTLEEVKSLLKNAVFPTIQDTFSEFTGNSIEYRFDYKAFYTVLMGVEYNEENKEKEEEKN